MTEQIISNLEKAAQIVLAPTNLVSNEERRTAEEVFLNFRKTKFPYQLCREILENNTNDYVLFETVGLIRTAYLREWTSLSKADSSSLIQYLLRYVTDRLHLANYVKTSLLQCISIILKRMCINDCGQDRNYVLGEIESLIMTGDLQRKVVGCDLIFAIMEEYSFTRNSRDIFLSLGMQLQETTKFQSLLKRIFKFFLNILDELMKKDTQEDTVTLLEHLLPVVSCILTWTHYKPYKNTLLNYIFKCVEHEDLEMSVSLKLDKDWEDVILLPSVLDLLLTVYARIRGVSQLAHHTSICLIQLATLTGPVVSDEVVRLRYILNYVQRLVQFVTSIDVVDRDARSIATIVKQLVTFNYQHFKQLPEDTLKSFINQLTRLTCMFTESTVQEDSSCTDCVYTEALNILYEAWIYVLAAEDCFFRNHFREICEHSSTQIFNAYLQCHLFAPEGKRSVEEKDLDRGDIGVEDDDKLKYKEQLQTIGYFGRQVLHHSLPLLARLIEDRAIRLEQNLNIIAGQVESLSRMGGNSMDRLYEDIHWLILIAGHVLCMESDGEVASVPTEILEYGETQVSQGKIDVDLTLRMLLASESISSYANVPVESIDHVVRLTVDVFRFCAVEKTAISINLGSILSPELSCTITWFFHRWCLNYFSRTGSLLDDCSETTAVFVKVFAKNAPGALWITHFLLDKVEYNINEFKSEPSLMEETVKLLLVVLQSANEMTWRSERYRSIVDLAMHRRYDLPRTVKRGLMRAIVSAERNMNILRALENRCKRIMSNENSSQFYHREETRVDIIDMLECCIGIAQGVQYELSPSFPHTFTILQQLPKMLSIYHNYQEIVVLILELLCEFQFPMDSSSEVYKVFVDTIENYGRCNVNRITTDSTAVEDTYQDILILIKLLNNVPLHTEIDIESSGLSIIIPIITTDLLSTFPTLCLSYFSMIKHFCQLIPKKILGLRVELLRSLMTSVEWGLFSFGEEAFGLCSGIIEYLVSRIQDDHSPGQPRNELMAPFLNTLLNLLLSHQINLSWIRIIRKSFYDLIRCYPEKYQQVVQEILSSQPDQQTAQRLANSFAKLNQDLRFDGERSDVEKFKKQFLEFAFDV